MAIAAPTNSNSNMRTAPKVAEVHRGPRGSFLFASYYRTPIECIIAAPERCQASASFAQRSRWLFAGWIGFVA